MKPVKLVFTLPHLYCLSIFSLVEVISLAQKRSVLRAPLLGSFKQTRRRQKRERHLKM